MMKDETHDSNGPRFGTNGRDRVSVSEDWPVDGEKNRGSRRRNVSSTLLKDFLYLV